MLEGQKTKRRALIAEYAFSLFVEQRKGGSDYLSLGPAQARTLHAERAWVETTKRLQPYVVQGLDIVTPFDQEEYQEVIELADRLRRIFDHSKEIVLRPTFPGCGYVDASEGDVIFGSTLYEVKTVNRPIRSSDIRQTITYAALNAASTSNSFNLEAIGLFNPRRGKVFDFGLEHVSSEISGRPAQELFEIIIQALSSDGISR
jgi:hypothetical protein